MYTLGRISVTTIIPEELSMLQEIANNLWWSWNEDALDLFKKIDMSLWEKCGRNPVKFLQNVSQKNLAAKLKDSKFMDSFKGVVKSYTKYMNDPDTWYAKHHQDKKNNSVAYFSAEYGITEVLPIYSGGLGVLSGDHCKSASDLGIPFNAIGLFYKQGYFNQKINREGWQETVFKDLNLSQLPILPVLDSNGEQALISVELPGRDVYARIWNVKVGRINLYLMDTDINCNSQYDRALTARLYGGDHETRIQQEIFLGIGGIRLLDVLGIQPTCYHMNEGHSSFMGLELIRKLMKDKNLSFREAKEVVSSCSVFTTHTPVPAGNDVFPVTMIDKYFSNYWNSLGVNRHEFLDMGLNINDRQNFNMTVLALTIAGRKNGVSELHGAVSRNIFKNAWNGVPEEEIPITHITNGIHTGTWLSPAFKHLYDKYLGEDWRREFHKDSTWDKVLDIPNSVLWKTHNVLKTKMIENLRERVKFQRMQNGESAERVRESEQLLDSNALTIGFARRFATYKRADLIFRNMARIQKIMNNPNMPVQLIFAGKAHPADKPAHEIIKNISDIAAQEGFNGKVVVVENYNMAVARDMVQGVDIWLNNPRRPLEASGTSGQKVSINGVLNFSVLDGWWCEGYDGTNGWSIGDDSYYENEYHQDNADSDSIYETMENEIVPLFYDRNKEGVPDKWVEKMKESIRTLTFKFSTQRMVYDYFTKMYQPAFERLEKIQKNQYKMAKNLAEWKNSIERHWQAVSIWGERKSNQLMNKSALTGESIPVKALVNLGQIERANVSVQVYYGALNAQGEIEHSKTLEMELTESQKDGTHVYETSICMEDGGEYGYTLRVIPHNNDLINPLDMSLIRWL